MIQPLLSLAAARNALSRRPLRTQSTLFTLNLFSFAPDELAYAAVLCWWLSWADDKYLADAPGLNQSAKDLIGLFLEQDYRSRSPSQRPT